MTPNYYSAAARAWPHARVTFLASLRPSAYENGLANFCQRLLSKQKPQNSPPVPPKFFVRLSGFAGKPVA
jgi:hypothetical protein